ncbi:MAG: hypothetical protein ABIL66_02590 [candidate division WOR-3 bacterium]
MLNHKTIMTIKTIITIVLLAIGFVFAGGRNNKGQTTIQEIDTTKLEKYEKKVIIDAKWGNGPGEFGIIKEACGIAPNCYTIDKNGNIYIVDPVNARVQIFDTDGRYLREFQYTEKDSRSSHLTWESSDITVDENGTIYILFYIFVGSVSERRVEVRKYNSKGELVDSFPIPLELLEPNHEETEIGIPSLLVIKRIEKIIVEDEVVKVEGRFTPIYFGKADSGEVWRYTLVQKNRKLDTRNVLGTKEIILSQKAEIKFQHLGYCGRQDKEGNYFYFFDQEKIGGKNGWDISQGVIYKYDKNGKLRAIIKHPFSKWGDVNKFHFNDVTQDIYCLTNDNDGVKLLLYRSAR